MLTAKPVVLYTLTYSLGSDFKEVREAMPYEVFTRKKTRTTTPSVSFSTLARVGLNQAATEIMKKNAVERVLLLWDNDHHRMAVRPITKKDPRAYMLSSAKSSTMFSAKAFLEYIGYDFSETRSFPADWNEEEGLLEIEIPTEHLKGHQQQGKLLAVEARKAGSK